MGFLSPKTPSYTPSKPPPPPNTPRQADVGSYVAGTPRQSGTGTASLVSTGSRGLARKASTSKKSLIGGSQ